MGFFSGTMPTTESATENLMSPIGLALQNLARFDSGGIDMPAAAARAQNFKTQQRQTNMSEAWLKSNAPDLLPLLSSGASPTEVLSLAFKRQQDEKDKTAETSRRTQLSQYITDPAAQSAFLAGELDFAGARAGGQPRKIEEIYDEATGQPVKGYFQGEEFIPIGGPRAAPAADVPGFNVSQASAAGYADRMALSDAILSDPKLATVQTDAWETGKASTPVVGNFLTSTEFQQADQAQRDFINAILRRESGAVISPDEFANARRQYFPTPGDNPEVLAQKARNRKVAISGVSRSAGPAYQSPEAPQLVPAGVGGQPMTATNPETGDRIVWDGSQWVPE